MSDNDQQTDTDLFEGSDRTDTSADAGTTDENTSLLDSEELQIESPKEEKKPSNSAEVQTQKNVDHWINEINSGRKSLSDLPADKQWIKARIEKGLQLKEKEPDIDRLIDERMAKKEADKRYALMKANIKSMKLKGEQLAKIQARQDQLISRGVPKDEALEIASEAAGISMDQEEQDRMILRQRMALPHQGTGKINDSNPSPEDPDFHQRVTDPKEKMKILMKHMRS